MRFLPSVVLCLCLSFPLQAQEIVTLPTRDGVTQSLLFEDGCFATPYREARKLAENRQYPLITVKGSNPATSEPCEAFSAHGFLGKEPDTVEAIVNWMLKKPYRKEID